MSPRRRPERPKVEREYNVRDPHDALRFIKVMVAQAAYSVSETMQDHLDDDQVVRHMHDAIGSLAAIRDVANLQLPMNDSDGPGRPRMWGRLTNPLAGVKKVRTMKAFGGDGTVWEARDDQGEYWTAPGWEGGVSWERVLGWGPVEEVL